MFFEIKKYQYSLLELLISFSENSELQKGLYLHEIGHAVGLVHEHQRPIRDRFIRINYGNVHPSLRQWFQKYPQYRINNFNYSYEFSSVMHYGITVRNLQIMIVLCNLSFHLEGYNIWNLILCQRTCITGIFGYL